MFWSVDVFKLFQYLFVPFVFGMLLFSSCFRILLAWKHYNTKTKRNEQNSEILLMFWSVDVFKLFQNFVSLKTLIDQNKRNEQNSETAWKHQQIKKKGTTEILKQLENINIPKTKGTTEILKQLENINRPCKGNETNTETAWKHQHTKKELKNIPKLFENINRQRVQIYSPPSVSKDSYCISKTCFLFASFEPRNATIESHPTESRPGTH